MARLLTLSLLLVMAPGLVAQHVQQLVNAKGPSMIDGSQHPELIPDSAAYHLVLVNLSELPNPSQEQIARQLAFLRDIGLSNADLQASIPILTSFKVQYLDM